MKKYIFLLCQVLILLFSACTKSDPVPNPPIVIVNEDPAQYGIPYQNIPQTEDIVMYEINIGAFSQPGNFNGITARLDSIKRLGINTIWLMPIFPVGEIKSIGSPYCVRNYKEVNPGYGTLDNLRNLVAQAHNRNIAVIIDWVGNHTAWDNAWMSHKAWYSQDINGNIISPPGTNWNDVADLNYNNMEMRSAMISAMKFWALTANIDGFRCDAADFIPFDFWKQAIDTLHNMKGRNFILLAEGSRNDHFTAGFQMNYAWDFYATLKNVFVSNAGAGQIFTTNSAEYSGIPVGKRKLRFTTNHDESGNSTPVELFNGKPGALAASVIAIFLQGVPLIYCGQEVGVSNKLMYSSQRPVDWSLNPDMLARYRQLLAFYNRSGAMRKGTLQVYNDTDVVAFEKKYLSEDVLLIVNTRNRPVTYSVPSALRNSTWSDSSGTGSLTLGNSLTLNPYQYYILTK